MAMLQGFVQSAAKYGTRGFHWSFWWSMAYNRHGTGLAAALMPTVTWDTEVEAVNTYCLITQHSNGFGPNGLEFDVRPYANDHIDSLRFLFDAGQDVERARQFVISMASTIELDEPVVPSCVTTLRRALKERVSPEEFSDMVMDQRSALVWHVQSVFDAAYKRYMNAAQNPTKSEAVVAGARGVAMLSARATRVLGELLDAYEAQVRLGASNQDLHKMSDALQEFNRRAFAVPENFGDEAELVRGSGVLNPTPELKRARERLVQLAG